MNPIFRALNFTLPGGGSFPTTSVLDNFNRANEGPPPSGSWGGTILSAGSHGMKVGSNQCGIDSSNPGSGYWNTTYGPNQEVYGKGVSFGSSYISLFLRLLNPTATSQTCYEVYFYQGSPANTIRVYRWDSSSTNAQLGGDISQTVTDGDSIGASISGSTITVYYKAGAGAWTSLGTRTDATYSASGYVGVAIYGATLDDFGGGTI